jgi:hypothetical protein
MTGGGVASTSLPGWKGNLATLLAAMAARGSPSGASVECGTAASVTGLLDRWSDDLYRPEAPMFRRQFSAAEMGRLRKFDAFLAARRAALLATAGDEPPSSAWCEVATEAADVLADLGWGRLAP